jgi:protein SCO1/2
MFRELVMRKFEIVPVRAFNAGRRRMVGLGGALAMSAALPARIAQAADDHSHHHHHTGPAAPAGVKRTEAVVKTPDVTLVRQDGTKVALPKEFDEGGAPILLTFIYTSCTTVCPVMSKVFSDTQKALGKDLERVKLVSISIDPEYDTPARLTEYAKQFGATPRWQHYTGTVAASVAVQKAFNAYRGDKMNHAPVAFVRAAPGKPWVRYDGFASPATLVQEYRTLVSKA